MKLTLKSAAVATAIIIPTVASANPPGQPNHPTSFVAELPNAICVGFAPIAGCATTQRLDLRNVDKFRFATQAFITLGPINGGPPPPSSRNVIVQYQATDGSFKCLGDPCATALVTRSSPPLGAGSQFGYVNSNIVKVQGEAKRENVILRFSWAGNEFPGPVLLNTGVAQFYYE